MKSLFIHDYPNLHSTPPGGVQICSKEFLSIIRAASESTELFSIAVTRSPFARLRRFLGIGSYMLYRPEEYRERIAELIRRHGITHVFLNCAELLRFGALIKSISPELKVIIMSHGNSSGDNLYEIAGPGGRHQTFLNKPKSIWKMGLDLYTESTQRHASVDLVCVMSQEERVLEQWLGCRRTLVVPRLITREEFNWKPAPLRLGYVGTLNHTPNLIALRQIFDLLVRNPVASLRIRVVGRPADVGERLASEYPFVDYLGALEEDALKPEAETWSFFLNPIFWLSRGASMKFGKAISWGLPVLSTRFGVRGYELAGDDLPITEDRPEAFVSRMREMVTSYSRIEVARKASLQLRDESPSLETLAERLRQACLFD